MTMDLIGASNFGEVGASIQNFKFSRGAEVIADNYAPCDEAERNPWCLTTR